MFREIMSFGIKMKQAEPTRCGILKEDIQKCILLQKFEF